MTWVFFNGELLEPSEALLPADAAASRYGSGLFETLLLAEGQAVFAAEHWQRLRQACSDLHYLEPPLSLADLRRRTRELARLQQLRDGCVRLSLFECTTGWDWCLSIEPPRHDRARTPLSLALALPELPRELQVLPGLGRWKTNNYQQARLLRQCARRHGLDDVLWRSASGELLETTTANVFGIRDDTLWTAPLDTGILPGVTRLQVLDLAGQIGIEVTEQALTEADLPSLQAAFVTNSLRGVWPIKTLGAQPLDAHPLLPRLQELWQERVQADLRAQELASGGTSA